MKTRYISVAAGDGREFLIPNEDLVTQKVTNWTYTDKNTLVKVNFGTNYDADPHLVCKLAIDIGAAAPRAIKSKAANCILTEFAEAGMKFALTFWIADPDGLDNVKSEVMLALWDAFKREGIRGALSGARNPPRGGALPVETSAEAFALIDGAFPPGDPGRPDEEPVEPRPCGRPNLGLLLPAPITKLGRKSPVSATT